MSTLLIVVSITAIWLIPCSRAIVQVDVISLLPFNVGIATDLIWSGAALSQAVEKTNRDCSPYLNFSLTLLYNTSHKTCVDTGDDSGDLLTRHRYSQNEINSRETIYALVLTSCTDLVAIQGFAKELDWLIFNSGLAVSSFLNKEVHPTALAIGGTYRGFSLFILQFLESNQWRHITVLEQIGLPGFNSILAIDLTNLSKQKEYAHFSVAVIKFTTAAQSMTTALNYAKTRSRVMLFLTSASVAKSLLILSHSLGFHEEEYVFINAQPMQLSGYGKASEFDHPQPKFSKAFQSMIYITSHSSGIELQALNDELIHRTKLQYNQTYPPGEEPLDSYAVEAAYDVIGLIAIIANETLSSYSKTGIPGGRDLAGRMANRTYSTDTGQYYINSAGARYLDMDVYGYTNNLSPLMERYGVWSWATRRMSWSNNTKIWPTGSGLAPLDVPICGFSGHARPCAATSASDNTLKTVLPTVILLAGAIAVLIFVTFKHQHSPEFVCLSSKDLIMPKEISQTAEYSLFRSIYYFSRKVRGKVL